MRRIFVPLQLPEKSPKYRFCCVQWQKLTPLCITLAERIFCVFMFKNRPCIEPERKTHK